GALRDVSVNAAIRQRERQEMSTPWLLTTGHGLIAVPEQPQVVRGEVMFWAMPDFEVEESVVDRMWSEARRHATLVLDLRGNPGGLIRALERMVSNAFDHDVPMFTQVTRTERVLIGAKSRKADAFTGQLIVLIDSQSASAAEIFARLVQISRRGIVIGD